MRLKWTPPPVKIQSAIIIQYWLALVGAHSDMLFDKGRKRADVYIRHSCYYLVWKYSQLNEGQLQRLFRKDRTTIRYGIEKIQAFIEQGSAMPELIAADSEFWAASHSPVEAAKLKHILKRNDPIAARGASESQVRRAEQSQERAL